MTNTTQMLSELYRIYDALNEHYWESSLPPVFITIVPGKGKTKSVYGTFTPESWAKNEGTEIDENGNETTKTSDIHHEIAISAEYFTRPIPNWCATLQHEMVHLYCKINEIEDTSNNGTYHNKQFKVEAEKHGLIIEKADIVGWSITTPGSDFIDFINSLKIDEDTFSYFRQTRLALSKTTPKKRFVCPLCGLQAQAKKTAMLICGECGKQMDYWNLTDPDNPEIIEDFNDGLYMEEDGWYNREGFC